MYLMACNDKRNYEKNIKKHIKKCTDCINCFFNTQIFTEMWVGFSCPRRAEKGHEELYKPF